MSAGNDHGDRTIIRVKSHEDLISKITKFDAFRIVERLYSAEQLIPQLVIDNKDLLTESAMCAAFVLYWGRESARARRWHAQVEASYRTWRDSTWLELKQVPVPGTEDKPKFPTDGMADKLVRMQPNYGDWWRRLNDSQEAAENAEAVHLAFQAKAEMIKSQQRLIRDEAGGPYHVVEDPRQTVAREPQLS